MASRAAGRWRTCLNTPTVAAVAAPVPLLPGIQLLRGLSVLLVLATHADIMAGYRQYAGTSPVGLVDTGLFGVSIFFTISGFIIAIVALRRDLTPRHGRAEFAWRRFVRIVPFLWVAVTGYNLLSSLGTGMVEWLPALRALAVWPVGELKPNVVWSLRHEGLFYALFALTMLGARRRPALLLGWFVAPLVAWPILLATRSALPTDPGPWAELFRVVVLGARGGANLQFGGGFLLGWLTLNGSPLVAPRRIELGWVALATVLVAVAAERLALPIGFARTVVWSLLALPPVWLAIVGSARQGPLLAAGNALGDASFSLYLVHNAALLVAFEAMRRAHVHAGGTVLALGCVAALAAGLVAHRLIERPLIAAINRRRAVAPWQLARRAG